jgi:outer membrane immunogenic protein
MDKEDFMRVKFLWAVGLPAAVAACTGSAIAADYPGRPPPPSSPIAASPAFVPDWVGFYVGIHGCGGGGSTSIDVNPFFRLVSPPNASPSGGIFGGQVGYNWQWGPVVGGLEVDFSGTDIKETGTFFEPFVSGDPLFTREVKIDELASARGRLGYLIFPNWLLYGTAGIGWGHTRFTVTEPTGISASDFVNEFGWVVGAGLEWKFAPNWLLRGEWLHYDFGRTTISDVTPTFGDSNINIRTTIDVGRAALSYKF